MKIITLDLETYFTGDYTLSKMSTEEYIRDPRFEAHGCAIKFTPNTPAVWFGHDELSAIFSEIDWANTFCVSHHAHFDHLILNHHYNARPRMSGCTLSMARLLLGNHHSVSLDSVRKHFNIPLKTTPYNLFRGKRWAELAAGTRQQIGVGACDEVESIWKIFGLLLKDFPKEELYIIDMVVKMFTQPVLRADTPVLRDLWKLEALKKRTNLETLGVTESDLQSADRFAELLRERGIEPEVKDGKKGDVYCFAKTDQFMRDLQEHDDEEIRLLTETRLNVKSTILQTRAETLGGMARRGPMPVYLNYCGASTLRISGGDKSNFANFKRGSPIRRALLAPEGYVLAPIDSSQIECVAEGQRVLTSSRGWVPIEQVTVDDFVYDGVDFVKHEGVVYKGYRNVILVEGLKATPDHIIYPCEFPNGIALGVFATTGRSLVASRYKNAIREAALRSKRLSRTQDLWSAWGAFLFLERKRSGTLDIAQSSASNLFRSRNRSNRQRQALRSWKLKTIHAARKCQQSLYHVLGAVQRRLSFSDAGFQTCPPGMRVWTRFDQSTCGPRTECRTNNRTLQNFIPQNDLAKTAKEGLQTSSRIKTEKAKVYDIINCGPRYRFVCEGVVVSNCRVLHYLAGGPDEPVIQKFRKGEDPYVDIATEFYKEPIYKPKKDDPRREEMEAKRGMGKQGRLMCGYGAAGPRFKATAKAGLYGPSVNISIEDANEFVALYRRLNPSICARNTGYWAQAGRMLSALGGGPTREWGPLTIKNKRLYLPEGQPLIYDTLEYYKPAPEERHLYGRYAQDGHWRVRTRQGWKEMWGSKLVQNVCEAVSRVIVSQAAIRIMAMGYRILNWPYDELLVLIPKDGREEWHAERCKAEMLIPPKWLPGLPLDAEYVLSERYSK